jgi:APA family basic amino acid/polyamine antiporter
MSIDDKGGIEIPVSLERGLGVVSTCMLGLGAMIGAGIFVLIGHASALAGPAIVLAFALNAGFAVTVGACYAELAIAFPRTGGAYVWVGAAFGRRVGFLAGFCSWGAQTIACALYALGFGTFAVEIVRRASPPASWLTPASEFGLSPLVFALVLLGLLAAINSRGSRDTGRAEIAITGLKIALLLVLVGAGAFALAGSSDPVEPFRPFLPEGMRGVLAAMGLIFIAFEGYEIIAQTREEIVAPARTIPLAIFTSIGIACLLYVAVAIVMFAAIDPPAGMATYQYLGSLGELGLVEAAGAILPAGDRILLVAGLASTASALNATLYSASRIALAMGRQGDFPARVARVDPKRRTPVFAIALTTLACAAAAIILPLRDVAAAANLLFFLVFMSVAAALIQLRRSRPALPRPFRVPLVPWWPGTALVGGFVLSIPLFDLSPAGWVFSVAWVGIGFLITPRLGRDDDTHDA